MTLLFHPFEIVAIGLSVIATTIVALDGESNWVEGLQLLAIYLVFAVGLVLVARGLWGRRAAVRTPFGVAQLFGLIVGWTYSAPPLKFNSTQI